MSASNVQSLIHPNRHLQPYRQKRGLYLTPTACVWLICTCNHDHLVSLMPLLEYKKWILFLIPEKTFNFSKFWEMKSRAPSFDMWSGSLDGSSAWLRVGLSLMLCDSGNHYAGIRLLIRLDCLTTRQTLGAPAILSHDQCNIRLGTERGVGACVDLQWASLLTIFTNQLYSVKCYPGGQKIHFIPSVSKIQIQMGYHCVQYTRRHIMNLISHF